MLEAFRGEGMERQGEVRTAAEARAWVARMLPGDEDRLVVAVDVGGTMVGCVGVGPIDRQNLTGWFWYWMREDQRGRGITSRAAATVAAWALGEGGLARLELGHRANNPESGAVARAAGFVQEGVERAKFLVDGERVDVLTYGRLATDPTPATEHLQLEL